MRWLRLAYREVVGLYWDSRLADDVPALAWFLLASLAPLALGLTALATLLLGDSAEAQALAERLSVILPDDAHAQVVELVLRTRRDSPLLLAGSVLGMVWASSSAVGVLSRSLARLLGLPRPKMVAGKFRNAGVAASLAIIVVLMTMVASAGTDLVRRLGVDVLLVRVAVLAGSLAITLVITAGVFRWLAGGTLAFRAALWGGLLTAILLQVTPTAAGYYLTHVVGQAPVQLFLMLAGVLFTCYLAAFSLLLGAGLTARLHAARARRGSCADHSRSRASTAAFGHPPARS